ncbi:MAG TPA: hypothetical protein VKD66_03345 [Streptosporangiaceae bacterium]|nr:hypothetical protein [Streptosporangiaceae bacterium]
MGAALAWAELIDAPVLFAVVLVLHSRVRREDRRRADRLLAALLRAAIRLEALEEQAGDRALSDAVREVGDDGALAGAAGRTALRNGVAV